MRESLHSWHPTHVERWEECDERSSTGVARIRTDAGPAYLKAIGNAEGPHALVREWVGTAVARWFGLTTFDFAQITLEPNLEIPLGKGKEAEPGPAFVTRAERGGSWSGKGDDLKHLVNPEDVTGLVIADTWLLNEDRYPPPGSAREPNRDNVFLSMDGLSGRDVRLVAMDFSDCMKPPSTLTPRIADIGNTKREGLFGLFPEFQGLLQRPAYERGLARLGEAREPDMAPIAQQLPSEWDVTDALRDTILRFLVQRAAFLVDHLPEVLGLRVQEQQEMDGMG